MADNRSGITGTSGSGKSTADWTWDRVERAMPGDWDRDGR